MKYKMYTIYDKVAKNYGPPFLSVNEDVADRSFKNYLRSDKNLQSKDYELYYVCDWDDEGGFVAVDSDEARWSQLPEKVEEE